MLKDVRISSYQLTLLIMGFLFGSTAIIRPAGSAHEDAWLAYILAWGAGFFVIWLYSSIAQANPAKTLIDILKDYFGKYIGTFLGITYIWYFIHLASLVFRNFGDYMVVTIYYETPVIFIISMFAILVAYSAKKGLEVITRATEMLLPYVFIFVAVLFFALMSEFDLKNMLPVLGNGWTPVVNAALSAFAFPFGETVLFLMVFPALNKPKTIKRASLTAVAVMGLLILNILLRDLWVLGPDMLNRAVFPPAISTELIPGLNIHPIIGVNLLIAGWIKISVCIYAAALGVAQLTGLDDFKPLVVPLIAICVPMSLWLFDNIFEMFRFAGEIYPYYSSFFQIFIPLVLLLMSKYKKAKTRS